ncbi:MAG: hypothetical protein KDB22_19720 [Planctomycetales bacterium]|nr:hypothetical protein [Planctomycetales bacterium]
MFLAIWMFIVPTVSDVTVVVRTEAGVELSSNLVSLSQEELVLMESGQRRSLPVPEVARLSFLAESIGSPSNTPGDFPQLETQVTLIDGTRFKAAEFESDGATSTFAIHDSFSIELPTNLIQNVQLAKLTDTQQARWQAICEKTASADIVGLLRPEGTLEPIEGMISAVTADAVRFKFSGQTIDVPRSKIGGIRTFTAQQASVSRVLAVVEDALGNRWPTTSVDWNEDQSSLAIKLPCDWSVAIPLSLTSTIDFQIGRSVYLTTITPLSRTSGLDLPFNQQVPGLLGVFAPHVYSYRAPDSRREVPSIRFDGTGTSVYRIPSGYRRLTGHVVLAPQSSQFIPCRAIVLLDNRPVWEAVLSTANTLNAVDVAVQAEQRLELHVESKSPLNIGDSVIWIGLKLEK